MGPSDSYRVLLVDDDAFLLESVETVFAGQFGVHCWASGQGRAKAALRAVIGERK